MKIYIVAHIWKGTDLTIETFYTATKAVRRISELVSDEYGVKAHPDDDPQEYLDGWYEFAIDELDNDSDMYVVMEVLETENT